MVLAADFNYASRLVDQCNLHQGLRKNTAHTKEENDFMANITKLYSLMELTQ